MTKPNVLILFPDQQRYDTIHAAGHQHMVTPSLDRLVNEGTLYTQAYSPNPVCIPARHNLLTGLPARYHGLPVNGRWPMPAEIPTLPRILADDGYDTRAIGKMHFVPPRRHHGFNRMELMEEIPSYREDDDYATYLKNNGLGHIQNIHGVRNLLYMVPQRSLIPEEHHGTKWVADRSVDYILQNSGRRPFFLWAGWIAPHPPFDIPESSADLYRERELPEPLRSETPLGRNAQNMMRHADLPGADSLRRMREVYFSAISHVDQQVGRILDALEQIGQIDNTLIFHTSDHGEMLGDHGCFQKSLPYDSCNRIPFIVRYPKHFAAGSRCDHFVDLNDILPTVLDVAGIDYPGPYRLPGASLTGDLSDREHHYVENGDGVGRWVSMRDRRYKFTYYYGGGYEELFDMEADPHESCNLLHARGEDPDVRQVRDRLRERLVRHEARWGLKNYVLRDDFIRLEPLEIVRTRNGQFPRFPNNILDPEERAAMNSITDEVIQAVRDERVVKLHELDLETWLANGAPAEAVERIRREGL